MSDSLGVDVSKLKVVDLRKELKSRGLAHTGDKAELVGRLQAAIAEEMRETATESHDDAEIALDSDEIDSDAVLDDDASLNGTVDEELALAENSPIEKTPSTPTKLDTQVSKKRKLSSSASENAKSGDDKVVGGKKIVLKRVPVSAPTVEAGDKVVPIKVIEDKNSNPEDKILESQCQLKLRAERFGLPMKMTVEEKKAARMARFNQNKSTTSTITSGKTESLGENFEKLKKRAERFGQNVSKVMSEIEMKERLEKRKEKFGTAK